MAASKSRKRSTRDRQPWPVILAAVVGVASLALNGYQYLSNRDLNRRIDEASLAKLEHDVSVDLEVRYLVLSGAKIGLNQTDLGTSGERAGVLQNDVLDSLRRFSESIESGGKALVQHNGTIKAHGAIVLRIRNNGQAAAKSVILTVRRKEFPATGGDGQQPWLIDANRLPPTTLRLADLAPGQEVLVPLMHLIGSNRYLGPAYLPSQLAWRNATTGKTESSPIQPMAPEDQWIAQGLDVQFAQ